jgi:hypothetical protein
MNTVLKGWRDRTIGDDHACEHLGHHGDGHAPHDLGDGYLDSLAASDGAMLAPHRPREDQERRKQAPATLHIVMASEVRTNLAATAAVAGIYGRNTLIALVGQANAGKTFIADDLAAHHASGTSWRGHDVMKGAVLKVVCEGTHGAMNRVAGLISTGRLDRGAAFGIVTGSFDLCHGSADARAIAKAGQQLASDTGERLVLVTIDTLARVMGGGDENSGADMSRVLDNLELIRTVTGATVMVIHHQGKDISKGARGHSSLRAALDTELLVGGQDGVRTLSITKQRDLACVPPMQFELAVIDLGTDENGGPVTTCVVNHMGEAPRTQAKAVGRNQEKALTALREWCRTHSENHIATDAMGALLKLQGIGRQRKPEVLNWLCNAGILTPAVAGHTVNRAAL